MSDTDFTEATHEERQAHIEEVTRMQAEARSAREQAAREATRRSIAEKQEMYDKEYECRRALRQRAEQIVAADETIKVEEVERLLREHADSIGYPAENHVVLNIAAQAAREILPPPAQALHVASRLHADEWGERLIRRDGTNYEYVGTHWIEPTDDRLTAATYNFLDGKRYMKSETKPVPWPTSRGPVLDVVTALKAVAYEPNELRDAFADGHRCVAFTNGILDVETREFHGHTPDFFNTWALSFAYNPHASECPTWDAFLESVWPDDPESIATLQEVMGYLLVGGTDLQKIVMLIGPKRAGKGTIARLLRRLVGPDNVCAPTMGGLASHFGAESLVGKPVAIVGDARLGDRRDTYAAVERLLSISGEDAQTIPRKYRPDWSGILPTRFVVLTNEIPRFRDASGALASRFIILRLTESFFGREDLSLDARLAAEAPAIFTWALDGYDRLRERGHFVQPESGVATMQQLEDMASPVAAFVKSRCALDPEAEVVKDDLWNAWGEWCADEGSVSPGAKSVFMRDLRAAYPTLGERRPTSGAADRRRRLTGIRLVNEDDDWRSS